MLAVLTVKDWPENEDHQRRAFEEIGDVSLDSIPPVGMYFDWITEDPDGSICHWWAKVVETSFHISVKQRPNRPELWIELELCDEPGSDAAASEQDA